MNFIEQDIIEPLIKDIVDPVLHVLEAAADSEIETLAADAQKALAEYKPTAAGGQTGQASGSVLQTLAGGVQTAVDGLITEAAGAIPVVGALVAPEVVSLANQALDDLESKGVALAQSLIDAARTKLKSFLPAG